MADYELVIGNKNYSSWSLRPWVFLKHRGIPFEERRLAFDSPEWDAEIGSLSPTRCVPVLRAGDLVVWDSLAILESLAERHPEAAGWPKGADDRARARSACAEMHAGFSTLRAECPLDVRSQWPGRPRSQAAERDLARIRSLWCECLDAGGGPFLFGDFGVADAMYAPVALRLVTYDIDLGEAVGCYVDAIRRLPAIVEWTRDSHAEPEVIDLFEEHA